MRNAEGDMAVYFVQAPEGVYVMKIIFVEDAASPSISGGAAETSKNASVQEAIEQEMSVEDADRVIKGLLEEVVASPGTFASGVKDYIEANEAAYKELIYYRKHTLRYCFVEFMKGNQTDLKGHIMKSVCQDIMIDFGEAMLTDTETAHGQEWFDLYYEFARSLERRYTEEELKVYYPVSWFLIELADASEYAGKELPPVEDLDWEKIFKEHLQFEK